MYDFLIRINCINFTFMNVSYNDPFIKKIVDHVLHHHVAMNTFGKFVISQLCMTPSSASTDQLYRVLITFEIETLGF